MGFFFTFFRHLFGVFARSTVANPIVKTDLSQLTSQTFDGGQIKMKPMLERDPNVARWTSSSQRNCQDPAKHFENRGLSNICSSVMKRVAYRPKLAKPKSPIPIIVELKIIPKQSAYVQDIGSLFIKVFEIDCLNYLNKQSKK